MLGRYSVQATEEAARALAAFRAFDPARHDPDDRCSVDAPCRYCRYDATAAVSAALLSIERQRSEEGAAGPPVTRPARVVDLAHDRPAVLAVRRTSRRA